MNPYEQKQEERRQRLAAAAEKRDAEAGRRQKLAIALLPEFGQPILVGHHSEKRHRAMLRKSDQNMRKASELMREAKDLRHAAAAVGTAGVSSDDPDAIDKLQHKLECLVRERDEGRRLNAWWRKHRTMVGCPGLSEETAKRLDAEIPTRYTWERQPCVKWRLSNLGAEIRRVQQRIASLGVVAARSDRPDETEDRDGYRIVRAFSENRLRLVFPDKPDEKVRAALKQRGFRWSPTAGAWQRQFNNTAEWAIENLDAVLHKPEGSA